MSVTITDRRPSNGSVRRWLHRDARADLVASLVVFLVALPLSIGIAAASNAPTTAGLIAAIVGGIAAGSLGGSPLTVSGPAAGLTVVVAGLIDQFGFAVTCAITAGAGVLQVILGLSRIARVALAISPAVLHAMLAGIGITIVLSQLHVLLGGAPGADAVSNLRRLPHQLAEGELGAVAAGTIMIAILLVWRRLPSRFAVVPGPLIAIVGVTALSVFLELDVARVDVPGSLLSSVVLPQLPQGKWGAMAIGVVTLAIIGSVESLLSSLASDRLAADGRRSSLDRELIGQGVANTASGLLGGLPITGVIVRSSTNIAAGARTRMSTILHGFWVLLSALALVSVIELVPMAALAGLLIVMGVGLVKGADLRQAQRHGELVVYLSAAAGVLVLNPLEGVLIGVSLAGLLVVGRALRAQIVVESSPTRGHDHWTVTLTGILSFASIPKLARLLDKVPSGTTTVVTVDLAHLDHAAFDHLDNWRTQHEAAGGTVTIDEISPAGFSVGGPERRGEPHTPRHIAPWNSWQSEDNHGKHVADQLLRRRPEFAPIAPLLNGLHEYQSRTVPLLQPVMTNLAGVQRPTTLFFTCADSRIVPNVITSSGPGDLFTVRNVGNLVARDDSVLAAIEYAIEVLNVGSIVVCGHSDCGGMRALLQGPARSDGAVSRWLGEGEDSLVAWRAGHPLVRGGVADCDTLAMVNVATQLDRIEAFPVVRDAITADRLHLTGLFYNVGDSSISLLDRIGMRFHEPNADWPADRKVLP
ncbi:MAG: carbonic anhydrase [Frankiales bacterium]|nr:carbonic anhydrase [Frankiales bacterium]